MLLLYLQDRKDTKVSGKAPCIIKKRSGRSVLIGDRRHHPLKSQNYHHYHRLRVERVEQVAMVLIV